MRRSLGRREVITLLGGAAAWPLAARAQQGERMRRIGVLMAPDSPTYVPFFVETLSKLGWTEDRNVHIDYRKSNADLESLRAATAALVALRPDVIFAPGLSLVAARTQTQTIPIVFTQTTAPVERGFIASLARPAGNVTGFTNFEPSIGGKWLGLLKEFAPKLAHSATMFNPEGAPHAPFLQRSIEEASRALGIKTMTAPVRTDDDVENWPQLERRTYSMTSSARASSVWGTSLPNARAVFRLIMNWYLVGNSPGLAPFNMRST
jgi:putative ABC transport system substrate-binding protein